MIVQYMSDSKARKLLRMYEDGRDRFRTPIPPFNPTSIVLVYRNTKIVARYFIVYVPARICTEEYPYMFYTVLYANKHYKLFKTYNIITEDYVGRFDEYRRRLYGQGRIHKAYLHDMKYGYVLDQTFVC